MIKIGKTEIQLNLNVQKSTEGRPFRLSGVSKKGEGKWISGNLKSHWVYSFKYLLEKSLYSNVKCSNNTLFSYLIFKLKFSLSSTHS